MIIQALVLGVLLLAQVTPWRCPCYMTIGINCYDYLIWALHDPAAADPCSEILLLLSVLAVSVR